MDWLPKARIVGQLMQTYIMEIDSKQTFNSSFEDPKNWKKEPNKVPVRSKVSEPALGPEVFVRFSIASWS